MRYEVHQRKWNSGISVATIFESNDMHECERFADAWNSAMDKLYEGTRVGDECCHFAEVFDMETKMYIYDLMEGEDD